MKKIVIFILMTLCVNILIAQNESTLILGSVTNQEGVAVEGAEISVFPSNQGAVTDASGKFKLLVSSNIKYTFTVNHIGYEVFEKEFRAEGRNYNFSVQLKDESFSFDEVVVKGTRANERTPIAVMTLSKSDLEKTDSGQDIPYQLSLTPSVVTSSETGTGIGYSALRIRGTDPSRINVTVNGIPLNDSESQGVFWVNMPDFISSVDDVQIQRGVGTSTNGSSAFGATINFRTSGHQKDAYAKISSSVGSYNTYKNSLNAGTGLINDHFTFDVRYSELKSDGYIDRTFSDHKSLFMSTAYHDEKTLIKANVIIGDQRTGISWWGTPDYKLENDRTYNPAGKYKDYDGNTQFYDGQTDNYKQNHYQLFYSYEMSKNLNINLALHYTEGKGYYEQYKASDKFSKYGLGSIKLNDTLVTVDNREYVFKDSLISRSDIIRQKWLDNKFGGVVFSMNYTDDIMDVSFGANANRYHGDHFGEIKWAQFNAGIPKDHEWYRNTGEKDEASSFLKANIKVDENISLYGDLQYRYINYEMSGFDDDAGKLDQKHTYNFFNPKFGIFFTPNEQINTYASFAVANREPSRADLKEAAKAGGDEFPDHETLYDLEAGFNFTESNFMFGVNAFYMSYSDQLVNTGRLNSVGYPIMENVDKSYRAGLEFVAGVQFDDHFKWEGNLTYSKNKIEDYSEFYYKDKMREVNYGETDISYSPEIVAASILTGVVNDISFSLTSKFVGDQYIDNTSSDNFKIEDYFVNNLSISYVVPQKLFKTLFVQFTVNNIFNEEYVNNGAGGRWFEKDKAGAYIEQRWKSYYPQAPRHYMFKTVITL